MQTSSRKASLFRLAENFFIGDCAMTPPLDSTELQHPPLSSTKALHRSDSSSSSIDDEAEVREGAVFGMSAGQLSDVDSREASPLSGPLHLEPALSQTVFRSKRDLPSSTNSCSTGGSGSSTPRLTLSAFRRPEHTIRLTNAEPSRKLETDYDVHTPECGVLGHGAFSTVRLAVRRCDSVKVAVKSIAKHEALRSRRLRVGGKSYMEEWEILRRFRDHPHVITLLDIFENDDDIQLVMEYCRGGELFDAIQKKRNRAQSMRRGQYSETQAAIITSQILRALVDLHAQGIVHRDVKPENILLVGDHDDDTNIHVKLCDFGVARALRVDGDVSPLSVKPARSFSILGSDYYVAPEVCIGHSYDTAVDIYSLGVTLHVLLCGFPPVFSGHVADQVIFPNSYWKDISNEAMDLVERMLVSDFKQRISARAALGHPWIASKATPSRYWNPSARLPQEKTLDLELVHRRLFQYQRMERDREQADLLASASARKRPAGTEAPIRSPPSTRRRLERATSTTLMALTDLYRSVSPSRASVSASTAAAAASSTPAKDPATAAATHHRFAGLAVPSTLSV